MAVGVLQSQMTDKALRANSQKSTRANSQKSTISIGKVVISKEEN